MPSLTTCGVDAAAVICAFSSRTTVRHPISRFEKPLVPGVTAGATSERSDSIYHGVALLGIRHAEPAQGW